MTMGRVSGKVALITGGASGLGRQSALQLAQEGARVAVSDRNFAGAQAVAREIGGDALAIAHDVTDEEQWLAALARVEQTFGRLNVLVHSAGIGTIKNIEQTSLEEWHKVQAVNLDGPFLGCKHALARMRAHAPGSIIILSSVAGLVASPVMAAYHVSKAGAAMLARTVAVHCARMGYNIRCNSIHPAYIDTPMVDRLVEELGPNPAQAREKLMASNPMRRIGEPLDVAHAVVYLASDESKFVTGAQLVIDGGLTAV